MNEMAQPNKKTDTIKKTEKSYDNVVYDSHPFYATHPGHLSTIARVFGIENAVPLANARVLELGCAAGGNIIPHAANGAGPAIDNSDVTNGQQKQTEQL